MKPNIKKLEKQVDDWNQKNPVGIAVEVTKDDRTKIYTNTRSEAWILSGHSAVIMVEGISGCYLLERVKAL